MKYKRFSIRLKFRSGKVKEVREDNYFLAWDYYMKARAAFADELIGMSLIDNNDGTAFETMGEVFYSSFR